MPEIRVNARITITEDEYDRLETVLDFTQDRYDQNIFQTDVEQVIQTLLSSMNACETVQVEKAKMQSRLDRLHDFEQFFIMRGYARQLITLQVLAEVKRPCSLNHITTTLISNPAYAQVYKSQSKNTVLFGLKTLVQLGYVSQIERGIYALSEKGRDFLERNNINKRSKSALG